MHCEFPGIEQSRDPDGVFCKEICLWIFPSKWNRNLFVRLTSSQLIWRTTLLFDTISISLLLQHRISQATLPAFVRRCYLKNCSGIFLFYIDFLHQKYTLVKKWVFWSDGCCCWSLLVLSSCPVCGCRRVPWKSGGIFEMQKVDQWRFIHTQVFCSATKYII